jgi:deleted-in-malignant-brain-tumors protein 1
VRLVGGSSPREGRVEFCRKSVWVTECNRFGWERGHAAVVCRQLGFSSQGAQAPFCCADFGPGPNTQPVDRPIFYCTGAEATLSDCRQSPDTICSHDRDANVICQE